MWLEKYFIKVVSYNFKLQLPLLGKEVEVRPLKIIHAIVSAYGLYYFTYNYSIPEVTTIFGIVRLLSAVLGLLLNTIDFVRCFGTDHLVDFYSQYSSTEDQDLAAHREYATLLRLCQLKYILRLAAVFSNLGRKRSTQRAIFTWVKLQSATCVMDVVVLKLFLAKRLKSILSRCESAETLNQAVEEIRDVMKCNRKINSTYGPLTGMAAVFSFLRFLTFLYSAWTSFGLGEATRGFSGDKIFSKCLYCFVVCLSSLLLALISPKVEEEVKEIKFELDVTMTARNSNKLNQQLVLLFLQEIHNEQVQMSPLGLFCIGRVSLATAAATIVSYMLVLIQFSS